MGRSEKSDNNLYSSKSFLDRSVRRAYLLMLALLSLVILYSFKEFIFLHKVYAFSGIGSDSIAALYPYIYNTSDYIQKHSIPSWSFNMGMGQSIFPLFLRDPFDLYFYFTDKHNILTGLVFIEIIKILLSGSLFFRYLKILEMTNFTAIIGSLSYSFCGYMVIGSVWHFFSFEALNMAMLLLSFELFRARGKWWLFPISIFFIGVTDPLNLYMFGVFLVFYAFLRMAQTDTFSIKSYGKLLLTILGLGIVGVLLSSPFLLENIVQMIESPRVTGANSLNHSLSSTPFLAHNSKVLNGTVFLRLFSNDMLGAADKYTGWKNTFEAPTLYCGLLCLLLIPQLFSYLKGKVRAVFISVLIVWCVPAFFPFFRYAFWLFSGNYYREYSLLITVFFLFYAVNALDNIVRYGKVNKLTLSVSIIVYVGLVFLPYFPSKKMNVQVQAVALILLITYSIFLYLFSKQIKAHLIRTIFLTLVTIELCFMTATTVDGWEPITVKSLGKGKYYEDNTVAAIKYLKGLDSSFYRIDKNYYSASTQFTSYNDGMVQDYHGTSSYNSFNQLNYVNYLQLMGIANPAHEYESRWAKGIVSQPILECENRVKYLLAKGEVNNSWLKFCDTLATFGDIILMSNKLTLPFGFTYTTYIKESEFKKLNSYSKMLTTVKSCVVKDADITLLKELEEYKTNDRSFVPDSAIDTISFEIQYLKNQFQTISSDSLILLHYDETHFSGTINATQNEMIYLSIPFDNGWHVAVDDKPAKKIIVQGGMTGILVAKGCHKIEMEYRLRFLTVGMYLSLLGFTIFFTLWRLERKRRYFFIPLQ